MIQRLTSRRTILISPAPVCEEKHAQSVNEQIERYAEKTREIAKETGCFFIDLWAIASKKADVAFDGVSITESGYELLANEMMYYMQAYFSKR